MKLKMAWAQIAQDLKKQKVTQVQHLGYETKELIRLVLPTQLSRVHRHQLVPI